MSTVAAIDHFVIQQAEIRASRMVSSNGFRRDEWEDLRQDLLLDYLERLPQFDPDRGDLRGFMFGVVRHRAAQLAAPHRRRAQLVADNGSPRHRHAAVNHDLRLEFRTAVEFSLFHAGTGTKLDLWKGDIVNWPCDAGPEFKVTAADGLYELNLPYPTRKISRTCWKPCR